MAIWDKNCPKCGNILDDNQFCSRCGYSAVTGISGTSYFISSATWTSPSFYKIVDAFAIDLNSEKSRDELVSFDYIDGATLADFVEWGYLERISDKTFRLTELGKASARKNLENR